MMTVEIWKTIYQLVTMQSKELKCNCFVAISMSCLNMNNSGWLTTIKIALSSQIKI